MRRAPPGPASYLERRRAEALARQQAARAAVTARARVALAGAGGGGEAAAAGAAADPPPAAAAAPDHAPPRQSGTASTSAAAPSPYADILTRPEWMSDVPSRLTKDWLATPRPEGVRCLVIAARGRTTIRSRSGALLHTVATGLPGGRPGSTAGGGSGGGGAGAALDCVLQPDALRSSAPASASTPHLPGTLYALDLLAWAGVDFTAGEADFRVAWLGSKLAEEVESGPPAGRPLPAGLAWVPICALPTWAADAAGLTRAVRWEGGGGPAAPAGMSASAGAPAPTPIQDGVLLRHRAAPYAAGEASPLALLWKDAVCSRHFVDGWVPGSQSWPPPPQTALLRVGGAGGSAGAPPALLETGDDPPARLVLAGLEPGVVVPPSLAPGHLVRVTLAPAGGLVTDADGAPAGLRLAGLEAVVGKQGCGDGGGATAAMLSKLVFQSGVRSGEALGLDRMLEAAAAAAAATDG